MAKLDYLVSKLNVHGVNVEPSPGGGAGSTLAMVDVYGALGMGHLNPIACLIGLAVYTRDDKTIKEAVIAATLLTDRLFATNGWSSTKPYQQRVNQWVIDGIVPAAAAKAEKLVRGETLKRQLTVLAIDELVQNNICKKCKGTGYINTRKHDACKGTGQRPHSEQYNADMCFIEYDAWMKTWRHRYKDIKYLMTDHLNKFENHLTRRC